MILELAATGYVTLQICQVSFDEGVPLSFVLTGEQIQVPKEKRPVIGTHRGFSFHHLGGPPCVKVSIDGMTIFVLGPPYRIIEAFSR